MVHRFTAIAALHDRDLAALDAAGRMARHVAQRREIVAEGTKLQQPLLLLDGWACRTRLLADGRRQILQFVLPGEVIGNFGTSALTTLAPVLALTPIAVCPAPAPGAGMTGLAEAYAVSRDLEERYLLRQITRLGRMNAYERMVDWLCETDERLNLSGLRDGAPMTVPLTQEIIADALGLTNVHVNRTLAALRRDKLVQVEGKTITLLDRNACRAMVRTRGF